MKRQATIISRLLAIARSSALRVPFLFLAVLGIPGIGYSNPSGATVRAGSATFTVDGNDLIIETPDQRAIIDWQDFSIGLDELTQFVQPGANAAVLNRVTGSFGSTINGQLSANGQIFLINPHGIMVGPNGQIDASSFVASTLDVQNADFLAGGDLVFSGDSDASIVNLGSINALGGDVFMFARHITNQGTITAADGTVGLGAGQEVLLKAAGDERIQIKPNGVGNVAGTGIDNQGVIESVSAELKANGGNIYALGIKNSGRIRAAGAVSKSGRVFLVAGPDSDVEVSGTGRVTAEGGADGGVFIEGRTVSIADTAVVEGVDLPVEIEAADLFLGAQARLSSGTADMTITATGDGASVGEDRKGLNLSNDELARIESGNFYLNADAGIMVDGAVVPGSIGGRFFFDGGASGVEMIGGASEFLNGGGFEVAGSAVVGTDVTSVGGQTFLGNVEVADNVTFRDDNGGDIELLAGAEGDGTALWGLTIDSSGPIRIQGDFGSINPFASFDFRGGGTVEVQGASLHADGNTMTFANPYSLSGPLNVVDTGDVTFTGTVDGDGTGPWPITVNTPGTTFFNGVVGGNTPPASIETDGAGMTEIAADITTIGSQTFNDGVVLTGDVVLTSTAGGNLIFNSSVNLDATANDYGLTLNTSGVTAFNGEVGATGRPESITTDAVGSTQIGADITTDGSTITFMDPVVLTANSTVTELGPGNVTFQQTVDGDGSGPWDLSVDTTGGGDTIFQGIVGGVDPLGVLTTDVAGNTQIGANVSTVGNQVFNDPVLLTGNAVLTGNGLTLGVGGLDAQNNDLTLAMATQVTVPGTITNVDNFASNGAGGTAIAGNFSTAGSQTYGNAVTLTADATLASTGGGNIGFGMTLDGGQSLIVNTAGTSSFAGEVGGTTPLTSLNTDIFGAPAGEIGGITEIGDDITTTSYQSFADGILLTGDAILTSTGGNTISAVTVDGAQNLTVNTSGATSFGEVGGTAPLASLETDMGGIVFIQADITTTGSQTFRDNVRISGPPNITLASENSGAITFSQAVDAVIAGVTSLTVNTAGTTTFGGDVGGGGALGALTTDDPGAPAGERGGTTGIAGDVDTTGDQTYNDAVDLTGGALQTLTGDNLDFNSTLNGGSMLLVNSGAAGATTFGDEVGGTTPLTSLTTNVGGTTEVGDDITTTGNQAFNDPVLLTGDAILTGNDLTLGGGLDGQNINNLTLTFVQQVTVPGVISNVNDFTSNGAGGTLISGNFTTGGFQLYDNVVTLGGNSTLSGGGDITFNQTVDGASTLTVNTGGTTSFMDVVGGTTPLTSLTTDDGGGGAGETTQIVADVTTTGNQTYNDAVNLTGGGMQTLTGDNLAFNSTLDGASMLLVNSGAAGTTTFGDEVGGTTPLTSLTTNVGGTTEVGDDITTTGNQAFNDPVLLTGDAILTGNDLTLGGGLDGQNINNLTLTFVQQVTVPGVISNVNDFTSNGAGGTLIDADFTTTGFQLYDNAVTLGGNSTLTGNGNITFNQTVNGASTLAVNTAATTTFAGVVGGTTPLISLTTDGPGLTQIGANITTDEDQTFNDAVTLIGDETLTGNDVTFASTLNGAQSLIVDTVNTGADGVTTFGGVVGGTTPLTDLMTNAEGSTRIGADVRTTNFQDYDDIVVLTGNATLNSDASGNIDFAQTVDGDFDLVVNTAGTSAFNGEVGGNTPLESVTTDGPGLTQIAADVTTDEDQAFNDAVTLIGDATLTGNDVTFASTLNGAQSLIVDTVNTGADGVTTFGGVVGGTTPLTDLTTNAEGSTRISANITTAEDQTFNDAVALIGDATLTGNDVTFGSTLNGAQSLIVDTVNTGVDGVTTFGGVVGGTTPLTDLMTNAEGSTRIGADVRTTNFQEYDDIVVLTGNATLTSDASGNIDFAQTVDGDFDLIVNTAGTSAFNGEVGGNTPLESVTTDGPGLTQIAADVTTDEDQTFNDAVTLIGDATLTGNDVTFASTLNGAQSLIVDTVNTGVDGVTTFGGVVGGTTPLTDLMTNAEGSTRIGADVRTTNFQDYDDIVVLTGNATLTSDASGNIDFAQTVDGDFDLIVNTAGTSAFNGEVGGNTPLESVTTDGPGLTQIAADVTTDEDQTFNDAVTLIGDATLTGNDVTFASTLNGAQSLIVDTVNTGVDGVTTFGGVVGGTTPLTDLMTNAEGSTRIGADVRTTNFQDYDDIVVLTGNATLTSDASGNIDFAQTVDGDFDLIVNTAGTSAFNGEVGGNTPLESVTTDGPGLTQIAADVTTDEDQTFNDAVTLIGDATLTGNDITFAMTLDSDATPRDLVVDTTGDGTTSFRGDVGSTSPLRSLMTNEDGSTRIASNITTRQNQVYKDAVVLTSQQDSILTSENSGKIEFKGTVDGGKDLFVNTSGNTFFRGLVGSGNELRSLTTDAGGATIFDAAESRLKQGNVNFTVSTKQGQTYNDQVRLQEDTFLDSNNGDLKFAGNIVKDGAQRFGAFTGGGGEFQFGGNVGSAGNRFQVVALQSDQTIKFNANRIFAQNLSLISKEGSITQNGGGIDAKSLAFDAKKTVEFNGADNDFGKVAGKATGDITIRDQNDLDIGTTNLYKRNGAVIPITDLTTKGSIALNIGGSVVSDDVIVADVLTVNSGGVQELLTDVNAYQGTGSSITIDELNEIELLDVEAATVDVMAGGQITATQVAGTDVTLNSTGGGVEIGSVMAGNELNLLATGDITQTGPFSADRLSITGGSIIDLPDPNNQLNILGPVERGGEFILRDAGGGLTIEGPINTGDVNSSVQITTKGGLTLAGGPIGVSGGGNQLILSADEGGPGGEINNLGGEGVLEIGSGVDAFLFATSINGSEFGGLLSDYFEFGLVYPDNFPFELPVLSGNRGFSMGFIFALIGEGDPDLLALSSFDFDLAPADILGDEDEFLLNSEENDEQLREYIARLKSASRDKAVENPEHITIGPFELTGYEFEMWGNGGVEPTDTGSPSMYNIPGLDGPGGVFEGGEPVPYPTNIELPGDDGAEAIPIVPASDLFGTDDPGGGGGGAATGVPDTEPAAAGTEAE